MLFHWLPPLSVHFGAFNLFRYLTFRSAGALLTAFFIGFFLGKPMISWLKARQKEGQPIRDDGPEQHHLTKKGTPTMGGMLILTTLVLSTLLWADLRNSYVWIVLSVTLIFGGLGAWDDYRKLLHRNHKGISGKLRLSVEALVSLGAIGLIVSFAKPGTGTMLAIPYLKDVMIPLGNFYFVLTTCVIVGSANAVNLTDGLDGLAIVPVMIAAACFSLIVYLVGNNVFAHYLQLPYVPNTGELAVVCGALVGSGLAFLWYNAPPAKIFMGDTGSLACGALLGVVSVIAKHELVLAVIGGLFVVEAVSVILQIAYFKTTGRRIFLMAPIHHHFEKKGWAEPTIVVRFWIIACILGLIGLSSLKLR